MAKKLRFRSPPAAEAERLDQLISRVTPGLSRRAARKLIGQGSVFVDGKRVRINGRMVYGGAVVDVERTTPVPAASETAPPTILLEGEDWVAVNKPSGMPTEPTRQSASGTLAEALRLHYGLSGRDFLAAVHRLDHDTSGVVLFARSAEAARALAEPFASRAADRRYLALVEGRAGFTTEIITERLGGMDRSGRRQIDAAGQEAESIVTTLARGEEHSLLLVAPRTGRTHQIRLHLAAAGHPLVGDRRYGQGGPGPCFGLHALALRLRFPPFGGGASLSQGGTTLATVAPPPLPWVEACARASIPPSLIEPVLATYARWSLT